MTQLADDEKKTYESTNLINKIGIDAKSLKLEYCAVLNGDIKYYGKGVEDDSINDNEIKSLNALNNEFWNLGIPERGKGIVDWKSTIKLKSQTIQYTKSLFVAAPALMMFRVKGNPKLLHFVQKYTERVEKSDEPRKVPYKKDNNNNYIIDKAFYEKKKECGYQMPIDVMFATAIQTNLDDDIYDVLIYDNPGETFYNGDLTQDYYYRRLKYVSYLKSHIPKHMELDDKLLNDAYDKILIEWYWKSDMDMKNVDNMMVNTKIEDYHIERKELKDYHDDETFEEDLEKIKAVNPDTGCCDIL